MACLLGKEVAFMNFEFSQKSLTQALKQQNIALYACIGMGISNIILVSSLVMREEKIILVPLFNVDHRLSIQGGKFNNAYFIDWADSILKTILIVNPDNVDWKIKEILRISSNSYGDIKKSLQDDAKRIKENELSTVFYPKEFTVNQDEEKVLVRGQYMAYLGREKTPVIKDKIYELGWVINNQGVVLVKSLKEINHHSG
jgi:type IV conjugative transfer system protein TraE